MTPFTLNPLKGITLKKAQGWIRKTVNGKRKRVPVDFTKEVFEERDGRIVVRRDGRFYEANVYDIRTLSQYRGEINRFGKDVFRESNKAGMKMSREEAFDLITERFNLYNKYNGWKAPVAYIYSRKSRVIRGTETLIAVKLRNGLKGWLTQAGKFISEEGFRELLHNVDQTSPAAASDISLLDAWDSLSPQQKADLVDEMQDFDWDTFWEEIGSDDPDGDLRTATNAYYDLIETIGDLLGW